VTPRRITVAAALVAALSIPLVAGAASPPAGVKAWLGVWKARWGTVAFDSAKYRAPQSPQDYLWRTQGTWVYHGLHEFFGGIGPRSGDNANQTFGGVWFIENGAQQTRGRMLIYRGRFATKKRFTGGYWKACDYYCKSHHPWKGKKTTSCARGGCKSRSFRYTFAELGLPENAPQYMTYSKTTLRGKVRVFANPSVPKGPAKYLGIEGKASGRGSHVHTENLGGPVRQVKYGYAAKRGAAYEKLGNGTQILFVPFTVTHVNPNGYPDCKEAGGVLELTDAKGKKNDRAIWYPSCGTGDVYRFKPPGPNDPASDYLIVRVKRS
jgi:hypothetical protein